MTAGRGREVRPRASRAFPRDGATNWIMLLIAIWAAGAFVALLVWGMHWFRFRALVRAARPLTIPLAIPAPLPVLTSSAPVEPGVIGILRPVLMLPDGIQARLSPQEQDHLAAALPLLQRLVAD